MYKKMLGAKYILINNHLKTKHRSKYRYYRML